MKNQKRTMLVRFHKLQLNQEMEALQLELVLQMQHFLNKVLAIIGVQLGQHILIAQDLFIGLIIKQV